MANIIIWVKANGASVIAAVQVLLKAVKELLTALVNLVSIFVPNNTWKAVVAVIRAFLNKADAVLEAIKVKLID